MPLDVTKPRAWAIAASVLATVLVFLAPTHGTASPPTLRAADFVDSIAVNVHMTYTDSAYANIGAVITSLRYLGVTYVRDYNLGSSNQGQASYGRAARAGIRLNLFQQGGDVAAAVERMRTFAKIFPGSIASIEGPNEVNNFPVSYGGKHGEAGAQAFQAAFYGAVKADPVLAHIPVYGVTSWPVFDSKADFANFHSYPAKGDQPLARLVRDRDVQSAVMPGKPTALTEAGYYTLPGGGTWGGVDPDTQAKLILNLLFDATRLGVHRTFLYQLLDAYPDPTNSDMEKHFGLFDIDNKPKPAATAIRNLTTILRDPAPNARSFTRAVPPSTVSGLPGLGSSLVMQKASGELYLILWSEPDIWNEATNQPIAVPAQNVTIDLGGVRSIVKVFDPIASAAPLRTYSNVETIQVELGDRPVVVSSQ